MRIKMILSSQSPLFFFPIRLATLDSVLGTCINTKGDAHCNVIEWTSECYTINLCVKSNSLFARGPEEVQCHACTHVCVCHNAIDNRNSNIHTRVHTDTTHCLFDIGLHTMPYNLTIDVGCWLLDAQTFSMLRQKVVKLFHVLFMYILFVAASVYSHSHTFGNETTQCTWHSYGIPGWCCIKSRMMRPTNFAISVCNNAVCFMDKVQIYS